MDVVGNNMTSDIFDDVLNLEEQYHQEGYEAGFRDGAEAGRIEGRSVGMKQGYEKFVEAGRLQGRALVWANRIPRFRSRSRSRSRSPPPPPPPPPAQEQAARSTAPSLLPSATTTTAHTAAVTGDTPQGETRSRNSSRRLPDLAPTNNARLEKNVATLYGMVEPGTLSTRNDDEAVNDVDSRVKGAQGKLKVIERVVGEKIIELVESHGGGLSSASAATATAAGGQSKNSNIEDIGGIPKPPQPPPPPPKQGGLEEELP